MRREPLPVPFGCARHLLAWLALVSGCQGEAHDTELLLLLTVQGDRIVDARAILETEKDLTPERPGDRGAIHVRVWDDAGTRVAEGNRPNPRTVISERRRPNGSRTGSVVHLDRSTTTLAVPTPAGGGGRIELTMPDGAGEPVTSSVRFDARPEQVGATGSWQGWAAAAGSTSQQGNLRLIHIGGGPRTEGFKVLLVPHGWATDKTPNLASDFAEFTAYAQMVVEGFFKADPLYAELPFTFWAVLSHEVDDLPAPRCDEADEPM